MIAGEATDCLRDGLAIRLDDKAVDAVFDKLQRAAGIASGDDRFLSEKRFQCRQSVVLVKRHIDERERVTIQTDERRRR